MKGPPGPYKTKFMAEFWPRQCVPLTHPQEKLTVHLKVVTPGVPIPIPPPPPELAAARSLDDGSYFLSTGINEAITRYARLLAGTRINAAAAAWWGSGGRMIVVVPAAEVVIEPGAIVGLLGLRNQPGLPTGFYLMRLGPKLSPEPDLELVDPIVRIPIKIPPELMGTRITIPGVDIYTSHEEPGARVMVKICIGIHKADCTCIGIYIEF